jgi:hypothetical protein
MRMVDRVHDHTPHFWPTTQPTGAPSFADDDICVLYISDLPERGHALNKDFASLT